MSRLTLPWPLLPFLVFCLAAPALSEKDDDRGSRGRGGEHRSEQAEENSNAQWSDDAKRGQDRAEERRHDHGDEDDRDDGKGKKDKKDEKDKREKKDKKK